MSELAEPSTMTTTGAQNAPEPRVELVEAFGAALARQRHAGRRATQVALAAVLRLVTLDDVPHLEAAVRAEVAGEIAQRQDSLAWHMFRPLIYRTWREQMDWLEHCVRLNERERAENAARTAVGHLGPDARFKLYPDEPPPWWLIQPTGSFSYRIARDGER